VGKGGEGWGRVGKGGAGWDPLAVLALGGMGRWGWGRGGGGRRVDGCGL
jgi:hypothetical protein